jgi:hypothetical protein
MSTIVSIEKKNFKFYENEYVKNPYYDVLVTVTDKIYENGENFYYIDYKYNFIPSCKKSEEYNNKCRKTCFPFNKFDNKDETRYNGEIVKKNELTTILVKFLLMDNLELEKHTGSTTAQTYRSCIMESLSNFWD